MSTVGDTTKAEMKSCGLAALAPLATMHPSPPSGRKGDPGVPGRGTETIASANLQIEPPEFDSKNLPEWTWKVCPESDSWHMGLFAGT